MTTGKHVLLIHGFLESENMWADLMRTTSRKLTFHTVPLAGHLHGNPALPSDIDGYAEDILKVMDKNKINEAFLVGHSMGGYCALAFAKKYPQKVRGICLFHSTASADNPEKKADRKRAMGLVSQNKNAYARTLLTSVFAVRNRLHFKEKIDSLVAIASDMSEEAILAAQHAMMNRPSSIEFLAQRTFPLFYFLGELDELLPPSRLEEELDSIPGIIVERSSIAGHMGQYEDTRNSFGFIRRVVRAH